MVTGTPRHTPPLTDEELAWLGKGHQRVSGFGIDCAKCHMRYPCITVRLIADLRASRERIKELEAKLMHAEAYCDPYTCSICNG